MNLPALRFTQMLENNEITDEEDNDKKEELEIFNE